MTSVNGRVLQWSPRLRGPCQSLQDYLHTAVGLGAYTCCEMGHEKEVVPLACHVTALARELTGPWQGQEIPCDKIRISQVAGWLRQQWGRGDERRSFDGRRCRAFSMAWLQRKRLLMTQR